MSVVARPLRRTACAHVGIIGWYYPRNCARSFCGHIVGTSLKIIIARCCMQLRLGAKLESGGYAASPFDSPGLVHAGSQSGLVWRYCVFRKNGTVVSLIRGHYRFLRRLLRRVPIGTRQSAPSRPLADEKNSRLLCRTRLPQFFAPPSALCLQRDHARRPRVFGWSVSH